MKKLLALAFLLITTPAFAGTISIAPFISNNDVTIPKLETQRTTLQNWANGNVEGGGSNIKQASITSYDLATSVNPNTFRDEAFNDWTFSGMLPVTSGTLSSNISAGTSYINGVRVVTAATAHTYTASKDTYVYINAGGFFEFTEVANGAAAPSTPTNDLLLAKVVSSGTALTSVSDLRTTSIQITANGSNLSDNYRNLALVSRDTTTTIHVEPGQIAIGNTLYTSTADTSSKSTATLSNWVEGSVPTLNNLKFYVYAFNNSGSTFDFKYASADPTISDTSSNTGGTLQYLITGGVTYRALAWVSADSTGTIQTSNYGNFPGNGIINKATFQTSSVATGTTVIPSDDTIPQKGEGDEYMNVSFRASNANSIIRITVVAHIANNTSGNEGIVALFRNADVNAIAVAAERDQVADDIHCITYQFEMTAGNTNVNTFRVRAGYPDAGTTTFNGKSGARKFGGAIISSITAQEILA